MGNEARSKEIKGFENQDYLTPKIQISGGLR